MRSYEALSDLYMLPAELVLDALLELKRINNSNNTNAHAEEETSSNPDGVEEEDDAELQEEEDQDNKPLVHSFYGRDAVPLVYRKGPRAQLNSYREPQPFFVKGYPEGDAAALLLELRNRQCAEIILMEGDAVLEQCISELRALREVTTLVRQRALQLRRLSEISDEVLTYYLGPPPAEVLTYYPGPPEEGQTHYLGPADREDPPAVQEREFNPEEGYKEGDDPAVGFVGRKNRFLEMLFILPDWEFFSKVDELCPEGKDV